ncbi:MAG: hypothetical protein IJ681_08355 [Bacteroidales bacterium]|nr:hypothetical protein [Bacteroidales bacterium]
MNIQIRYYSKTGHMKKMAQVIERLTGARAMTTDNPLTETADVLFLGSAIYVAGIDNNVKKFIATLEKEKVKNVICFSSAAILTSSYPQVKALLEKQGIHVDEREFHCKGQLSLMHRGHPDEEDLKNLETFIKGLNLI